MTTKQEDATSKPAVVRTPTSRSISHRMQAEDAAARSEAQKKKGKK
jgi:hypothetical protein